MARCRGYIAITEEHEERRYVHIIDENGQEAAVLETTGAELRKLVALKTGDWWTDFLIGQQHYVFHIRDQGVISSTDVAQEDIWNYANLIACGDILFHVCKGAKHGAYHDLSITAISDEGVLWQRTMSADRVLLGITQIYEDSAGGYTLLGEATANSRQIYDVFRLHVDDDWNITSLDMRTCDYLHSYNYGFISDDPFGPDMIHASSPPAANQQYHDVLVPFDVLPASGNDHHIRIR